MIPRQIASAFSLPVRTRGDDYFRARTVRILAATSDGLDAHVEGTLDYRVIVRAQPDILVASCTCPFAMEYGLCKHIWATLLQADADATLAPLISAAGSRVSIVATRADVPPPEERVEDEVYVDDLFSGRRVRVERGKKPKKRAPSAPIRPLGSMPAWQAMLGNAQRQMALMSSTMPSATHTHWPADRRIVYIADLPLTASADGLMVEVATEREISVGEWEAAKLFRDGREAWLAVPDAVDQQIAQMLIGAEPAGPYGRAQAGMRFVLRAPAFGTTLRLMCESGRCRVRHMTGEPAIGSASYDDAPPWQLRLRVSPETSSGHSASLELTRGDETMPLSEPVVLHREGILLAGNAFSRYVHGGAWPFVLMFRERPSLRIAAGELPRFLEMLYAMDHAPQVVLPPEAGIAELREPPVRCVSILPDPTPWRRTQNELVLSFRYGSRRVEPGNTAAVFDVTVPALRHRDADVEAQALETLFALGAKEEVNRVDETPTITLAANKLGALIAALVSDGWEVDTNGLPVRAAGITRASVRSGIDWFELHAGVRYGDVEVSLHDLLSVRRTGASTIALPDGSHGLLPLDWLARLGPIAAGSTLVNGTMRYGSTQLALLDALLATVPEPDVDETFATARTALRSFERVEAADPADTFIGTLRGYQREGLGWLNFLRTFGLGGCLADDMGLGKTVQVLALLESRRVRGTEPSKPSLVVVPRSLVFNWMREAERFTPKLRVLDYSGASRRIESINASQVDVVITTYGTLRRDAAELSHIPFDYAILDEAQAIKNASSASAKSVRLLKADHRLAMTGTPIENRLEELWSLFEFLNPGMLGSASKFAGLVRLAGVGEVTGGRDVLAAALRPVILRRTKEQVASDLPARVEQTLTVTLEGAQRKFYDGLLESYRRSVLERVDRDGVQKTRMHILEALLRLRQAACHPVLADPSRVDAPSAKLDALMPAIAEVTAQGHKVLVFSQFTSFLALVRSRLDELGTTYEYLDGKTRNREARVDRFQNDAACPVFLISLKAGGHGLNLTAADYVYLLDPWWNPAVEAQAIDRAHRIGQMRHVLATRIVARNTIEEKILELQASKRALADAILGQDQGVLAQIGRAELEMLLA